MPTRHTLYYFIVALLQVCGVLMASAKVIYVDVAITSPDKDGSSWDNAFSSLSTALLSAQYGDEIWIATGTYYPGGVSASRFSTFVIPMGIGVYGGFKGNETTLIQRQLEFELYPTILSGDVGISGDSTDNCFSVVVMENPDEKNVFDGLIIERGSATDEDPFPFYNSPNKSGGGMYIISDHNGSVITISNCVFRENSASYLGGALYIGGRTQNAILPRIINSVFVNNIAPNGSGGAIYFDGGLGFVDTLLSKSVFTSNQAKSGGAILITGSSAEAIVLSECSFTSNSGSSGSVMNFQFPNQTTEVKLIGCILDSNTNFGPTGGLYFTSPLQELGITLDSCYLRNQSEYHTITNATIGGLALHVSIVKAIKLVISNSIFESASLSTSIGKGTGVLQNTNIIYCRSHDEAVSLPLDTVRLRNVNVCQNVTRRSSVTGGDHLEILNSNISNNMVRNTTASESTILLARRMIIQNSLLWENDMDTAIQIIASEFFASHVITDMSDFSSIRMIDQYGMLSDPMVISVDSLHFSTDPLFVDPVNGNYRVASCSPAINTGSNYFVLNANLSDDFFGQNRIIDNVVDIGPYEHPTPFSLELTKRQNISCYGQNDGYVEIVTNGADPLMLHWNLGTLYGTRVDSLGPGNYEFILVDGDGCLDTIQAEILEPEELLVSPYVVNVNCNGDASGYVELIISGGVPPYSLNWSNGQNEMVLDNLVAGNYSVTISDGNECNKVHHISLSQNEAIKIMQDIAHPSTDFSQDGTIEITEITGGIPPFVVEWSDGTSGLTRDSLSPGVYILYVTDSIGCLVEREIVLYPIESIGSNVKIDLWPNPLNHNFPLSIEVRTGRVIRLNTIFYDMVGRKIDSLILSEEISPGLHLFKIPVNLPYGMYVVEFLAQDERLATFKIAVVSD